MEGRTRARHLRPEPELEKIRREPAGSVIRAGIPRLGGGILGQLLAADPGYQGLTGLRDRLITFSD
jgi:hypothetical protein